MLAAQLDKFSEVYRKTYLLQDQSKWLYQASQPWINKNKNNGVFESDDDSDSGDGDDSSGGNNFNKVNNNGVYNNNFNGENYLRVNNLYENNVVDVDDEEFIESNPINMFGSVSGVQPHIVGDSSSASHSAALLSAVCVDPAAAGGNQELPAVQIFAVYDIIMSLTHITDYIIIQATDDKNPIL